MAISSNIKAQAAWFQQEKPHIPSPILIDAVLKTYPASKIRSTPNPPIATTANQVNSPSIPTIPVSIPVPPVSNGINTSRSPSTFLSTVTNTSNTSNPINPSNGVGILRNPPTTFKEPPNRVITSQIPRNIPNDPVIDLTDTKRRMVTDIRNPKKQKQEIVPDEIKLLNQLVGLQNTKIELYDERFNVSESTSISLDAKQDYYKNKFDPKCKALEIQIQRLNTRIQQLKNIPISQPPSFIPTSTPIVPTTSTSTYIAPPASFPVVLDEDDFNTYDFSDYEDKDLHNELMQIPPEDDVEIIASNFKVPEMPLNLNDPRKQVLERKSAEQQHAPDISINEAEDDFGDASMDGLRTPTQERDDFDDLGSFIDDNDLEEDEDRTYRHTHDDSESEVNPVLRGELDDIRLSPDVAKNYGIKYKSEVISEIDIIEDNGSTQDDDEDDGVEEIEDFTTQLNEERELDKNVIELISDVEDEDESNVLFKSPIDKAVVPASSALHELKATPNNTKVQNIDSDFSDDDDELMDILTGAQPIPTDTSNNKENVPPGSEGFISEVYLVLNEVFKLKSFRSNQLEAIVASLQNKDVFVLMPTGGGKSLCYQLPALIKSGKTQGTTIVISPLISLMQDQVQHLLDKNVKAGMISSKASSDDNKQTINLFRDGFLDLVYLSPEKANNSAMVQRIIGKLYENNQLARVVIDEAHCLSSWGHDFRPDYQGMGFFKEKYPKVPLMALTATANEKVRMDIIHNLKMDNPVLLKQSFNRGNLFYEIKWKNANYVEWIKDFIVSKHRGKTGIIYCHSKQSCEQTSAKLNLYGLKTSFYHAGMTPDDRFNIQQMWQSGRVQLICATIAFGMGIDKPDVRFVIHLFIPRSLEGYYQETGRAGRDGKHSECIMFYSYKDARQLQNMIHRDEELTREGKENHLAKLRQVVQYCENTTDCRRKQVLHYFNESFNPIECRKQCDNCLNASGTTTVEKNCTEFAKDIIQLVKSIQDDRVTVLHCQDVFKGSNNNKIVRMGHNSNPFHGKGKTLDKTDVERIFFYLLSEDCLVEYQIMKAGFASNYVRVGKFANLVLRGQKEIKINFSNDKRMKPAATPTAALPVSAGRGADVNLSNFKYTESFVTARQMSNEFGMAITLPQNNFNGEITSSNKDHIEHCYNELKKIGIDTSMEMGVPLNLVVKEMTLKDMAVKLPTNKRDFGKLLGVSKDQLDYFNNFKKLLGNLSRDRKKASGSPNTSMDSQASSVVSPYFHLSQRDEAILNTLRSSTSQRNLPLPTPTQRNGTGYKKRNFTKKRTALATQKKVVSTQKRREAKGMPL